jgi:cbb3-type cytochrome oxidase subunit 3
MRYFSLLIILLIFSVEIEAKKRNSWGNSKKSSFKSKKKISKSSRKSSFDKKREEKLKKERSSKSYSEYLAKKEALKNSKNVENKVASSGTTVINNNIEIEFENDDYEYRKRGFQNHKVSKGFNSLFVILIFVVLVGIIFFISFKRKKEIVDIAKTPKEMPLDLRVGGIVDVESVRKRLLLNKTKLQMKIPRILKGYVQSVGFIELDEEMQIFNVAVTENIDDTKPQFSLQVEVLNRDVSSVKLYTNHKTIYPKNVDEWEEWLDGNEERPPLIGAKDFTTENGNIYSRVWDSGGDEVVRSKFIEKIVSNNEDEKDLINITSLYDRDTGNEIEYLSVSNIEDFEMNNFIQIKMGITIRENELEIV